jgi:hypothetical protein
MISPTKKILERILFLVRTEPESDWEPHLVELNIWDDVCPLYYKFPKETRKPNMIFAYIVLAYDKDSPRLDINMDRMELKRKIIISLAGVGAFADVDYADAAVGVESPYNEVIEFYVTLQKDKRFQDIIAFYDYHRKASAMSMMANTIKDMEYIGKVLKIATGLRTDADALLKEIQQENVYIDSSLQKEGRDKLSDRLEGDHNSHEVYMMSLNKKPQDWAEDPDDILNQYEEIEDDDESQV